MKFRIHGGHLHNDSFVIEGDTMDECRDNANEGVSQRGWIDPWSEKIEE
ncbi:hypothetical protein KAT92_06300 [Candidatus Babeliales bacterium]|nr:hypothetical protein [Candidatus Babeliales bacterium]